MVLSPLLSVLVSSLALRAAARQPATRSTPLKIASRANRRPAQTAVRRAETRLAVHPPAVAGHLLVRAPLRVADHPLAAATPVRAAATRAADGPDEEMAAVAVVTGAVDATAVVAGADDKTPPRRSAIAHMVERLTRRIFVGRWHRSTIQRRRSRGLLYIFVSKFRRHKAPSEVSQRHKSRIAT